MTDTLAAKYLNAGRYQSAGTEEMADMNPKSMASKEYTKHKPYHRRRCHFDFFLLETVVMATIRI